MTDLEAIENRISRRAYMETPIEKEKIEFLQNLVTDLNKKSGLSFLYSEDGESIINFWKSYGMFRGVKSLFVLKGDRDMPNFKEKVGYYGEILVLEATKLGLSSCWVGLTFDATSNLLGVKENEEVICVVPIGYAAEKKSLKESLIRSIAHRKSKSIDELCECDISMPTWLINGMRAVQKAPSAMNAQNFKFKYIGGVLSAESVKSDKYNDTDLGIAKLHFELATGGKFEMGQGSHWVK